MNYNTIFCPSAIVYPIAFLFAISVFGSGSSGSYFALHHDIKLAMEEADYKKAKSLVQTLIPILDTDIAYTKEALSVEDDEYMVNKLSDKAERQQEIRQMLEDFLSQKKKNLKEFDSLDVIRELRRLSVKPKER